MIQTVNLPAASAGSFDRRPAAIGRAILLDLATGSSACCQTAAATAKIDSAHGLVRRRAVLGSRWCDRWTQKRQSSEQTTIVLARHCFKWIRPADHFELEPLRGSWQQLKSLIRRQATIVHEAPSSFGRTAMVRVDELGDSAATRLDWLSNAITLVDSGLDSGAGA